MPNLRAVGQFGGWVGKYCEQTDEATNIDSLNWGILSGTTIAVLLPYGVISGGAETA